MSEPSVESPSTPPNDEPTVVPPTLFQESAVPPPPFPPFAIGKIQPPVPFSTGAPDGSQPVAGDKFAIKVSAPAAVF